MNIANYKYCPFLFTTLLSCFLLSCNREQQKKNDKIIYAYGDTIINGFTFVKVEKGNYLSGLQFQMKQIPYTFYIMKHEVTNAEYYQYLRAQIALKKIVVKNGSIYKEIRGMLNLKDSFYQIKKINNSILFEGDTFRLQPEFSNHPVTQINWIGCMDFCMNYGFILPNKMEWEKAARGMNRYDFPWGNEIDSSYANYWNSKDPYEPGTTPVGFYNGKMYDGFQTHNAQSPYGCYDMSGNAWEYLLDYIYCQGTGGAGGGFNYHTAAFVSINSSGCFGLPGLNTIERCDTSDGFRAIFRYE